jgi:hypothetical protein
MVTGQTGSNAVFVPGFDFNPYYGGNRLFMNDALGDGSGWTSGIAIPSGIRQRASAWRGVHHQIILEFRAGPDLVLVLR